MYKVGLVGAGKIAESFHLPAWESIPGAKVEAICDIDPQKAKELAARFKIEQFFTSLDEMLKTSLDIIDVCTPNTLHTEHALKALDYNRHVIIEKPFVTNSEDIKLIEKKAESRKKKVMCAQHQRFRPQSLRAKQLIDTGELGNVYYVRAQALKTGAPSHASFTDPKLSGGGPLMDLGAHFIDAAWWFLGSPKPLYLSAVTHEGAIKGIEDFASGRIVFENKSVLSFEFSYLLHSSKEWKGCEIFGTKAGLVWPDMILTRERKREVVAIQDQSLASVNELTHFLKCIETDESPLISLEESRTVIKMIEILYESAKSGKETAWTR